MANFNKGKLNSKFKHGMSQSRIFMAWAAMIARCYNPNNNRYHRYGGRGITVSDEWRHSFEKFFSDMGDRPSNKHSLDRIDNDGPYSAENCRWATGKEQCRNQEKTLFIESDGEKVSLLDACEKLGINPKTARYRLKANLQWDKSYRPGIKQQCKEAGVSYSTFRDRIKRGMSHEDALTSPIGRWPQLAGRGQ